MIPLYKPFICGDELISIEKALKENKLSGDGGFTNLCESFLTEFTKNQRTLLTSSCTHALEMAVLLSGIQPGDEVIMPSFNFVSAANAFALRGAKICFVDIDPNTLNVNVNAVASAISPKTKVILVLHYGGVGCDMEKIMDIALEHGLMVIEDAAHCIGAYYKEKHLGTLGHIGALSFHDTKNIQCGEGGALLINDKALISRAEIIREKGTNKKAFLRGETQAYSWKELGSSFLMSEISAAFLYCQLQHLESVNNWRQKIWQNYWNGFLPLAEKGMIKLPVIPQGVKHNGHIFYLLCRNKKQRDQLIKYLSKKNVRSAFHYLPLHLSVMGKKVGYFFGEDRYTTNISQCLLRLPIYASMKIETSDKVIEACYSFFNKAKNEL